MLKKSVDRVSCSITTVKALYDHVYELDIHVFVFESCLFSVKVTFAFLASETITFFSEFNTSQAYV